MLHQVVDGAICFSPKLASLGTLDEEQTIANNLNKIEKYVKTHSAIDLFMAVYVFRLFTWYIFRCSMSMALSMTQTYLRH